MGASPAALRNAALETGRPARRRSRKVKRFSQLIAPSVLATALAALVAVCAWAQAFDGVQSAPKPAGRGPVLVELFTSEGCPHCPEADALLEKLYTEQSVEGAQIIALEEHVDYWDRPAWVDHFSSPSFTNRQQSYADAMDLDSLYTPQMVVDGLVEMVGNNASRARSTISALGRAPLPAVRILATPAGTGEKDVPAGPRVRLEARGLGPESPADVFLVVGEDKLFSRVNGGRNAGESWPHSCIARTFHLAGKLPSGSRDLSLIVALDAPQAGWRVQNLRLIAFVQEVESRRILALGTAPLAGFLPAAGGAGQPAAARTAPPSRAVSKTVAASSNSLWTPDSSSARQDRQLAAAVRGEP